MDTKKLMNRLTRTSDDIVELEKAVVFAFVDRNSIKTDKIPFLIDYLTDINYNTVNVIAEFISNELFSIDELIEIFEMLIPKSEKKGKGMVYTPAEIKNYIISNVIIGQEPVSVLDPSCGCGSFLITAAMHIHDKCGLPYSEIISKYIYGVDIDECAIRRAKILLTLLMSVNNEYSSCKYNLVCGDMLSPKVFKKTSKFMPGGYDCVIGNPPYVRNKNMDETTKMFLSNLETSSIGNVDLYIPFYEIGLKLLSKTGRLGFISPNSYLQGANGKMLRKFLSVSKHDMEIIDFRDSQIFDNVTSYTCITIIDKNTKSGIIKYARLTDKCTLENHIYSKYSVSDFRDGSPWRMREGNIDSIISKLESSDMPLSKWKIRNGLATLKNDIFFFSPCREDDKFYYRIYNGNNYKIEKGICIKVAKPNIMRNENDLKNKLEIAIFPYNHVNNSFELIDEANFVNEYPNAYKFLSEYKSILQSRDKGHGNYPNWYAYGRTQGMNNFGSKLLIPYICDSPVAVLSLDPDVLFYCGYALISDDIDELRLLKIFLESDAFWYYIYHTSKPYSKGYMAFAKNYIVNFSIPNLDSDERKYLLSDLNNKQINDFIWHKYNITSIPAV